MTAADRPTDARAAAVARLAALILEVDCDLSPEALAKALIAHGVSVSDGGRPDAGGEAPFTKQEIAAHMAVYAVSIDGLSALEESERLTLLDCAEWVDRNRARLGPPRAAAGETPSWDTNRQ